MVLIGSKLEQNIEVSGVFDKSTKRLEPFFLKEKQWLISQKSAFWEFQKCNPGNKQWELRTNDHTYVDIQIKNV